MEHIVQDGRLIVLNVAQVVSRTTHSVQIRLNQPFDVPVLIEHVSICTSLFPPPGMRLGGISFRSHLYGDSFTGTRWLHVHPGIRSEYDGLVLSFSRVPRMANSHTVSSSFVTLYWKPLRAPQQEDSTCDYLSE